MNFFHFFCYLLLWFVGGSECLERLVSRNYIRYKVHEMPSEVWYRLLRNSLKGIVTREEYRDGDTLLMVKDRVYFEGYQIKVQRCVMSAKGQRFVQTQSNLLIPTERSIQSLNTSNWKVDSLSALSTTYFRSTIEAMFTTGTLVTDKNVKASILCIGVAGGGMNSYIYHQFPNTNITGVDLDGSMIKIARKWFQLKEDNRHRLLHENGVDFLEKAAKRGDKYDILILDTGSFDMAPALLAPVSVFTESDVIKNMATVMGNNGTIIINVVPNFDRQPTPIVSQLVNQYKQHFAHVEIDCLLENKNLNKLLIARQIPIEYLNLNHWNGSQ